jgi:N-acetylglutamate synthase-like GNAT family acetyltransferase
MLWHGDVPIGICIFATPAASIAYRTQFFGLKNPRSRIAMTALNEQLWVLQRVVIHPTYRGAGIAAAFVRRACQLAPVPWIETLSAMGQTNPFFERAGFTRLGVIRKTQHNANDPYRHSEPVYYLFDNRAQ